MTAFDPHNPKPTQEHYRRITIPKVRIVNGVEMVVGKRVINEPCELLKSMQRQLLNELTNCRAAKTSNVSHAFTYGRDIRTMSRPHIKARQVLKIDIKDFFPSTTSSMVMGAMRLAGYPTVLRNRVKDLCFLDDRLPQGAPTSPLLANIVGRLIDARIIGLCKKWRRPVEQINRNAYSIVPRLDKPVFFRLEPIVYTRYADDLVLSSDYAELDNLRYPIIKIIKEVGYQINPKKISFIRSPKRLTICGIVVNSKMSKPRDYRRNLRARLHNLIMGKWNGDLPAMLERSGDTMVDVNFDSIAGQVAHVKYVCPSQSTHLEKLLALASEIHNRNISITQQDGASPELLAYVTSKQQTNTLTNV